MKFSKQTIDVLKNYATINPSITFKAGHKLNTLSNQMNILASTIIEEDIPQDFSIYDDLPKLLGILSMVPDPGVEITNTHMIIRNAKNDKEMVTINFTNPENINDAYKTIGGDSLGLVSTLELRSEDLTRLLKSASILQVPDFVIYGDGVRVYITVTDSNNLSSNNFCLDVGETQTKFRYIFKIENIVKLMNLNYVVSLYDKKFAKFVCSEFNDGRSIEYWIACEYKSE